jgi:hypothetical protein
MQWVKIKTSLASFFPLELENLWLTCISVSLAITRSNTENCPLRSPYPFLGPISVLVSRIIKFLDRVFWFWKIQMTNKRQWLCNKWCLPSLWNNRETLGPRKSCFLHTHGFPCGIRSGVVCQAILSLDHRTTKTPVLCFKAFNCPDSCLPSVEDSGSYPHSGMLTF